MDAQVPYIKWLVVVRLLSPAQHPATPWTAAHKVSSSFTISRSLLRLMSIESVMLSNHVILCWPFSSCPVFPSSRVFSNELALLIRWPKYWNFSFSFSPFNEYSGLISFRSDWFDLLVVQGTLKILLQQGNGEPLQYSCSWEPYEHYEKAKRYKMA